jgi:hypothetical protein
MNTFWFDYCKEHEARMFLLFFDDLKSAFDETVRRLSAFLGVDSLSAADIQCIQQHNEGQFHRTHSGDPFAPLPNTDPRRYTENIERQIQECFRMNLCVSSGSKSIIT